MSRADPFPWSPLDALENREAPVWYPNAALEENEPELIAIVLSDLDQVADKSEIASEAVSAGNRASEQPTPGG